MKTCEALSEIIGFKKRNVSQNEFGKAMGVTKQYVGQIINKELTEEQINLLEKHFNIDFTKVNKNEAKITVDYYSDVIASCGNGTFEMSENKVAYDVPATLFPANANNVKYSMCHAKGNSMYPRIWDGDFVICEHPEELKIVNGELYIFCYDDQIYLKRLTKNINQIVVESENPDFPTQYIEKEFMNDVHLIGHVVCWGRMNEKYLEKRS